MYQARFILTAGLLAATALAACDKARVPAILLGVVSGEGAHTTSAVIAKATTDPDDPSPQAACPPRMALVEGEYCPDVEQTCLEWLEPPGDRYEHFRCARYK